MATPEIFLVAKTLVPALARVIEINAGVTTPANVLDDDISTLFYTSIG